MNFADKYRKTLLIGLAFAVCGFLPLLMVPPCAHGAGKHCLWKVSDGNNAVYLLGSIHMLKKDAYPLDPIIEQTFEKTSKLVLEVNLDEMNSQSAQQLMIKQGFLPSGTSIQDHLSKPSFDVIKEHLAPLGLNLEVIQRFKPWLLMLTMTVAKLQSLGYDPANGIDNYFFDKAKERKKIISALESPDFQIDLLDSLPPKTQEAALLQTVKELDTMEKEFDAIVKTWSSGDAEQLESTLLESFNEYPEVYEKVVIQRNQNWIPKIQELLREKGGTFVVVGAAHLIGERGVVSLLKQKGFSVEQQ